MTTLLPDFLRSLIVGQLETVADEGVYETSLIPDDSKILPISETSIESELVKSVVTTENQFNKIRKLQVIISDKPSSSFSSIQDLTFFK